ncbi:MAG: SDR family NAD(P)-dependent oxidoreductase [Eubacteriales bacterium]|nr:SDR family NAD(P)-dependent oxidoreductase [Eubacteriales bacterium]
MNRLKGKVAIITGSGSGFGRDTAELFAKEGAKVVVADMNREGGEKTVNKIKEAGNEASFVQVDIRNIDECQTMVDFAVDTYGALDVLYCNAGIPGDLFYDVAHMSPENVRRVFEVNVFGTWNCIHCAAPVMVMKRKGSIIATASSAAWYGADSAYAPTKGAIACMTTSVANELGRYNVRCNSISPYMAMTEAFHEMEKTEGGRAFIEVTKKYSPIYRLVEPIDVAYAAVYLASDESSSVTAMDIKVDCGTINASGVHELKKRG